MYIYGIHTCMAYLLNKQPKEIFCNNTVYEKHLLKNYPKGFQNVFIVSKQVLNNKAQCDDHQGLVLNIADPTFLPLQDSYTRGILVLDHITDPRNIGTIFRTALLFNIEAVIVTKDHFPQHSAAMYKAASGALEYLVPTVVTNLSRSLERLKSLGYWCIGLSHEQSTAIQNHTFDQKTVLLLGSEHKGLRSLTKTQCDVLLSISMPKKIENIDSLNVAQAATIAMYTYTLAHPTSSSIK